MIGKPIATNNAAEVTQNQESLGWLAVLANAVKVVDVTSNASFNR
ncbi:hypothetical protein RMSM_04421 [Rhodopirellula maiorica SM1]|uniref:Uncharacterized protein n=1 Tax=Rhodopirellula maiorica SM1 TaxID=1265738 RepID=M5RH25_9BACT|nr:hypothetical protein RMSM_04421 [Rhodopirellula maiorica SM1]